VTIFPILWVVRTALTDPGSVYSNTGALIPPDPTLNNLGRVLGIIDPASLVGQGATNISAGSLNFWLYLRNSLIVAGLITFGQTLFSSMAAYAFARLKFPFRDQIFFAYITGLMIPGIVLFLPNYILIRQLDWIGTFQGMVAPAFLMTPFAVFFMRQFFLSLNHELEEAALLDGATRFGVFWRVALPLMRGPLLTLALLTFIGSWNDYLWPLLVGRDEEVSARPYRRAWHFPFANATGRARLVGSNGGNYGGSSTHHPLVRFLWSPRRGFNPVRRLQIRMPIS
jgi:multiple sugar transport system permease protein